MQIWGFLVTVAIALSLPLLSSSHSPFTLVALAAGLAYGLLLALIVNGSRQLMKKKGFSAEANMGLNILIAIVGAFVLMGGLIWMSFRVADNPGLQGHINAETRSTPTPSTTIPCP